ncbi:MULTISPECIES: hypothetical protein [Corynebacterium]|uniref:hypothetical protein n=1 Tax=Corynebacterium TaxID=1716 RepID=UPI0008A1F522|nr:MULTISPECIES: hypothetical protein [Corynebacterium]OFT77003.1 hypothetical protein HMPREF3104_03605 [Corynebacterium sp. HMSC30G07]
MTETTTPEVSPAQLRRLREARGYYLDAVTSEEYTALANQWLETNERNRLPQEHHEVLRGYRLKRCNPCKAVKELSEFGLRKGKPRSECKVCKRARDLARLNQDRDAARAKSRSSSRLYRQRHPWKIRLDRGLARAIKLGAPAVVVTEEQLLAHWEASGIDPARSHYSGTPLTSENMSLDHFDPLNRPGTMGHTVHNLFPCTIEENTHYKRGLNPLAGLRAVKEACA